MCLNARLREVQIIVHMHLQLVKVPHILGSNSVQRIGPFKSLHDMVAQLQLGLWWLERGGEQVSDIVGSFVEVEAHALATKMLGNDVEL